MTGTDAAAPKRMKLRYAGSCRDCGTPIDAGVAAYYHRDSKTVSCISCSTPGLPEFPAIEPDDSSMMFESPPPTEDDAVPLAVSEGTAGGSARMEFERRHKARDKRVREKFPKAGGLLLAVFDDPQTTRAWDAGAVGEEQLGGMLTRMAGPNLRVLHDRSVPGTRANIDHIAITPTGVHVIDAKRYKGSRPDLVVEGGLLRPRTEKLVVGRRDCTKLIDGVLKQVALVSSILGPDIPVRGHMCFLDADWPMIGGSFQTRDVAVLWPKKLAKLLERPGELSAAEIARLQQVLVTGLPAAS